MRSDLTRAPVSSFASHSSAGPHQPGGAFYVYWQAAYHLFGQWHPRGGSQALTDALERRLTATGRCCSAPPAPAFARASGRRRAAPCAPATSSASPAHGGPISPRVGADVR